MLKVSFIQRLVIFCKDSNYIAAYSELIYKKNKKEMQSFARSLVTLLHIAFNSDKVTMENHLQHYVIERQKESEYRLIH